MPLESIISTGNALHTHTTDKAAIISELSFGTGINQAIEQGRRADFSLLLSLFSNDIRDHVPLDKIEEAPITNEALRKHFCLQEPQQLRSTQESYPISAEHARQFHHAGLSSAKLSHYLRQEALAYMPERTFNLPEEVYQNLSGHDRRKLAEAAEPMVLPQDLYQHLVTANRTHQIQLQV